MGEAQLPPRSISCTLEDVDLTWTSVPRFFTTRLVACRSLSRSSRAHIAPLAACLTSHPAASTDGSASRDSPRPPKTLRKIVSVVKRYNHKIRRNGA
jgi:hypothetical protein